MTRYQWGTGTIYRSFAGYMDSTIFCLHSNITNEPLLADCGKTRGNRLAQSHQTCESSLSGNPNRHRNKTVAHSKAPHCDTSI